MTHLTGRLSNWFSYIYLNVHLSSRGWKMTIYRPLMWGCLDDLADRDRNNTRAKRGPQYTNFALMKCNICLTWTLLHRERKIYTEDKSSKVHEKVTSKLKPSESTAELAPQRCTWEPSITRSQQSQKPQVLLELSPISKHLNSVINHDHYTAYSVVIFTITRILLRSNFLVLQIWAFIRLHGKNEKTVTWELIPVGFRIAISTRFATMFSSTKPRLMCLSITKHSTEQKTHPRCCV